MDPFINDAEAIEYLRIDSEDDKVYLLCKAYALERWRNAVDNFDQKILDEGFKSLIKIPYLLTVQAAYDERNYISDVKHNERINCIISSALLQCNLCYSIEQT